MTTKPSRQTLCERCGREHPHCVVCSPSNPVGLKLCAQLRPDGSVEAEFACGQLFEGYSGLLHGGVIAALLDGIMTHCLFAHDISAVTAEMKVRFLHPVKIGVPVLARARCQRSHPPLHLSEAELIQGRQVKAFATAKFLERRPAHQLGH